jgi:serine/threonine-protein kinase
VTDDLERVRGALGDRYAVERAIGHGGAATVYLARDQKHRRLVAIKVLRPELQTAIGADRFLAEIEIAARLSHPHILPVYDSGAAGTLLYYVMPYVEGESLADRLLREGQLPLADAFQIAREVADGLGYAHSYGIVHRDVKPQNILLSGGHAVIADFGIARALDAAAEQPMPFTGAGIAVGTPLYMSPEQAAGSGLVDARSDLYSLGCVLYEMLVGEPPFTGPTPQAIAARRLTETPHAIADVRESAPPHLEAVVKRALARVPADRFATALELAEELGRLERHASRPSTPAPQTTPRQRRRGRLAVVGIALAAATAVGTLWMTLADAGAAERPRLAVLPFRDVGPDSDRAFAEGVAEEIAARLGGVSGLRVVGWQTALRYSGDDAIDRILAELDVDYVLHATVSWDDSGIERRVKLIASLVSAADRSQAWADVFDQTASGLFDVQTRIAESVVERLGVELLGRERLALAHPYTRNPAAHEHYLVGSSHFNRFYPHTRGLELAIAELERAVALDTAFAAAYAKLAMAHAGLYARPDERTDERARHAREAARRAAALAPGMPDVIAAEGILAYWVDGDPDVARRRMERVLALEPENFRALITLTDLYRRRGDFDRAARLIGEAADLDPQNPRAQYEAALVAMFLRRFDDMTRYVARHRALDPSSPEPLLLGALRHLLQHGDVDSARAMLHQGEGRLDYPFLVALAAGRDGLNLRALARSVWDADQASRFPIGRTPRDTAAMRAAHYFLQQARLSDAEHRASMARVYYDSALGVLETRLGEPTSAWHHAALGEAYAGVGRRTLAVAAARRAVAAEPLTTDAYAGVNWVLNLAETYARVGDEDAAVDQARDLLGRPAPVTAALLRVDPAWAALRAGARFRELTQLN